MTLTTTPEQLVESIKAEILQLVAQDIIPRTVTSFADLHDYVDANCLGNTEEIFQLLVTESETDAEHQAKLDAMAAIMEPAQNAVDGWIKAGGVK